MFFIVIFSLFSEAGVLDFFEGLLGLGLSGLRRLGQAHLDLVCLRSPEGERIALDKNLERVAHRRPLYHLYNCSGYDTHIEEVLAEVSFTSYRDDFRVVSYL